jgi:hypothetical protein
MKHIIIKSIIGAALIIGITVPINLSLKKEPTIVKPNDFVQTLNTQSVMVKQPDATPIIVTPVVEAPQTDTIVQADIAPVVTKTIDDYMSEYFPNSSERLISNIKVIIDTCPDRFNDANIENSFIYMKKYFSRTTNSNPDIALNNFTW